MCSADYPPTLTLPLKGGGDDSGPGAAAFPPPLRGRVRVGGAAQPGKAARLAPCLWKPRERFGRTSPTLNERCGGNCGTSKLLGFVSVGRHQSGHTWSISSAFRRNWSSRLTEASTPNWRSRMNGGRGGWSREDIKLYGFGATKSARTSRVLSKLSCGNLAGVLNDSASVAEKFPPTLPLPLKGGGDKPGRSSFTLVMDQ